MSRKNKFTRRWLVVGIILVVMVVFITGLIWVYTSRKWQGKERFTLIRNDGGVKIESFDPATKKGIRVKLPQKLEISTVGGRGGWRIEALGELAKKYGWQWVSESLGDTLGVEITGIDQEMGSWDKLKWIQYSSQVEWKEIDLNGYPYTKEAVSVDGDKYLVLEDRWSEYARELFNSMAIINEGIGVVVINSAGTPGLGTHAAKLIENVGMRVVMINNDWLGDSQKCLLTTSVKNRDSVSFNYLKRVFKCDQEAINGDNLDITIRLGSEYRDWWLGK